MLTKEELQKYRNCLALESSRKERVEWTDNPEEQIAFIKKYAKGNARFYSEAWYTKNPKRLKAIYADIRKEYVKDYNLHNHIINNAIASRKKLELKMLGVEVEDMVYKR